MKIALVHELLTMRGGAERLLKALAEEFPDAPIYTLLYDEKKLGRWFPKERVRTPKRPFLLAPSNNHHLYLKHFPKMIESFDFSEFDLVISLSSAFAHGIITNGKPKHLCYVNSPARYLWDRTHDVLERAGKGVLGPIRKRYLSRTFHKLRTWDSEASARPDVLLAASKEVQRRVELYWRRKSDVVYPFVEDTWLTSGATSHDSSLQDSYFFIASTLVPYKRIDLAIEACNKLQVPLKIAGEGPYLSRLKRMAGPTVEFVGYTESDQLKNLMAGAQALLFPGEEDFGITPLEAMSAGTPVIAYAKGGALETIIEGKTGTFFREPTVDALKDVILSLSKDDHKNYSKEALRARAAEFSQKKFLDGIKGAMSRM